MLYPKTKPNHFTYLQFYFTTIRETNDEIWVIILLYHSQNSILLYYCIMHLRVGPLLTRVSNNSDYNIPK